MGRVEEVRSRSRSHARAVPRRRSEFGSELARACESLRDQIFVARLPLGGRISDTMYFCDHIDTNCVIANT